MDLGPPSKAKARTKLINPAAEVPVNPVTRTAVSLEYASLRHSGHCPLGMYVIPSAENVLSWSAVFFVHQGYYADSVLKFELVFPSDYPERPPTVRFLTDIFHPLISPQTRLFNLAPRFRPWRPKEHHVFDVLHWIKAAFKKHALDEIREVECLNKEAFKYHDTTSSFAALANQSSELSRSASTLFDTVKNKDSLRFSETKPDQLNALRTELGISEWNTETE